MARSIGGRTVRVEDEAFCTSVIVQVPSHSAASAERAPLLDTGTSGCYQGYAIDHKRTTVGTRSIEGKHKLYTNLSVKHMLTAFLAFLDA